MALKVTPTKSYMQAQYAVQTGDIDNPIKLQKRNILTLNPSAAVEQCEHAMIATQAVAALSTHEVRKVTSSVDADLEQQ